jgi:hypothetical protein
MRGAPVIRPLMFDVPLVERDLGSASGVVGSMSRTTMLLLTGISAVGLIYYFGKKKK